MEVITPIHALFVSALAKITDVGPITSFLTTVILLFLFIRVAQRLYYILRGHTHNVSFNPRREMDLFIKKNGILFSEVSFICKRDKVCLRYRKLGNGSKVVLLNNGVGTDFYMWLPTLEGTSNKWPIFREYYRGSWTPNIIDLSMKSSTFYLMCRLSYDELFQSSDYFQMRNFVLSTSFPRLLAGHFSALPLHTHILYLSPSSSFVRIPYHVHFIYLSINFLLM